MIRSTPALVYWSGQIFYNSKLRCRSKGAVLGWIKMRANVCQQVCCYSEFPAFARYHILRFGLIARTFCRYESVYSL